MHWCIRMRLERRLIRLTTQNGLNRLLRSTLMQRRQEWNQLIYSTACSSRNKDVDFIKLMFMKFLKMLLFSTFQDSTWLIGGDLKMIRQSIPFISIQKKRQTLFSKKKSRKTASLISEISKLPNKWSNFENK